MTKLSIIIVNYNSAEFLGACLNSLGDGNLINTPEIVVWDNGEPEEAMESISELYPEVRIYDTERHLSFGAANNRGAKQTSGEYLLFLNPDTVVRRDALNIMLNFIDDNANCTVVGPRLSDAGGKLEMSYGYYPNIISEAISKIRWRFPSILKCFLIERIKPTKVDWVSGAALMVKRADFENIGGYDELYPLYFEDTDLCRRIQKNGGFVYYHPGAQIIHHKGRAGGVTTDSQQQIDLPASMIKYRQGQMRYYAKFNGGFQNLILRNYLRLKLGKNFDAIAL